MKVKRYVDLSAKKKVSRRYAVCIRNEGNDASLERNKLYVVLPDSRAERHGLVRVIDEDGEDYLYSSDWFVAVEVPRSSSAHSSNLLDSSVIEQE